MRHAGLPLATLLACLWAIPAAAQIQTPVDLNLSAEERAWVAAHPVLRTAAVPDWPPFDYVTTEGAYEGINADMLRRIARMAGFTIEPVTRSWPELYRMLREKELDLCPGMQASPERAEHLLFTEPLVNFPLAIYSRSDGPTFNAMEELTGHAIVVERDYYEDEYLRDHFPDLKRIQVDNSLQALLKVSSGEADAYIGNIAVTSYLIEKNVLPNLKIGGYVNLGDHALSIGVRSDYPILVSILNKGIAALSATEKRTIIDRYVSAGESVALTVAERQWIAAHPELRMGIDPEFAPFEIVGPDGSYQGIAADVVALLNQRLGINMRVVHNTSWSDALQLAREKSLDVLPCMSTSEERQSYLAFTEPYLTFHRVVVTRLDSPFYGRLDDLAGLRVAVQQNTSHHAFITEETSLQPVLYPTFVDTLSAVARGEVDCAVGNAATTSYWIKKLSLSSLKLAVPVGDTAETLRFGVRKDWPELAGILNKGIASLTEADIQSIRNRWVDVNVQPSFDVRRIGAIAATVVALILPLVALVGVHNRRLRREINSRLMAEAALRESEENYRSLVEGANSIILRMSTDGRVLFLNSFGERFLGYTSSEIVGKSIIGTIVPETETSGRDLRGLMEELGHNPEYYEVNENENMTRDGRRVWVAWTNRPFHDSRGKLTEVLCVGNDVTAHRQAAEMLRRYEFIVNTVSNMMSVINARGCYEAVNDAWCSATGRSREEALGKSVASVWPEQVAHNIILPRLERCFQGELVAYEATIPLPTSGERICEVAMYPFKDETDHQVRAIVVAQDVTDRKQVELALQEAKRAAEAGNRAKSAFLANMSHEIRTPMNAVLGYTQLLQRSPNLSPEQEHALKAIRRSGDHLLALISDILELSRIEAGHVELSPETFSLAGLLGDLDLMFRVRTDAKGLGLTFDVAEEVPPHLVADRGRVQQVLINLIGNAVKFTERGGIVVRVRSESAFPDDLDAPLLVCMEVEDTGHGMDTMHLDAIFGSFEQVDSSPARNEGAGLGLTISRNFARLMGGDVVVSAQPGQGSCFTFTFRSVAGAAGDLPAPPEYRQVLGIETGTGPWRVLVVDDRDTNRDVLVRMLQPLGFETREASNGLEGLEVFESWRPQVVLVDIVMPVMDGKEAIRRMRALPDTDGVAIVALTASTLQEERQTVLALGANAFLRKPFREEDLLEAIRVHAHINYIYSDEMSEPSPIEGEQLSITQARAALGGLPPALIARLRSIVMRGAINESRTIVEEIHPYDPHLADLVRQRAEGYVLDELHALWEEDPTP
ncbi:MAG: transporter substrate-binding domain-containing protein [Candidatus Hydrogenedentes bacterium]|nr:transporter substrate-binding domain-containing protein [Candidatus Hydrogenedentota bacterium]